MVSRSGALVAQTYATRSAGLALPTVVRFNGSMRLANGRKPGLRMQFGVDCKRHRRAVPTGECKHWTAHDEVVQLEH